MWIFLVTLIAMLSMVILTEGDTRRYILQGAFVGSILSLILVVNLVVFVALH